jgi:hypothetical protein
MKKTQQYRGEAFRRGQHFLDAHADVFGAVNSSSARTRLDEAITKLDSAVNVQLVRGREVRGEMQRQEVLESDLRDRHMTPVTLFARGQLAGVPNFAALTPSAGNLKSGRLVTAALAMAEAAKPLAEQFSAAAFPEGFIQELTDAAKALQDTIDLRRRKIADRGNATSAVEKALGEARSAFYMIAATVSRIVPRDTPLYNEWLTVRRVVGIGVRRKKQDAAIAGSITPAATEVKSAAA